MWALAFFVGVSALVEASVARRLAQHCRPVMGAMGDSVVSVANFRTEPSDVECEVRSFLVGKLCVQPQFQDTGQPVRAQHRVGV